jgi:hypothetical protein
MFVLTPIVGPLLLLWALFTGKLAPLVTFNLEGLATLAIWF